MDRIQRSGLIALAVLLLTAFGAYYVGSLPGSNGVISPRLAAQDPAAMEGVKFLPPEQRKFFVGPDDFVRPPVRNPLLGGPGRNVDMSGQEPGDDMDATEKSKASSAGTEVPIPPLDSTTPKPALQKPKASPANTGRYIRVLENDNLTRIAKRELGDGGRWQEIAQLNQISKPYTVELGQLLWLPNEGGTAQPRQAASPTNPDPGSANAQPRSGSTYRVGQNETASHISKRFFGTTQHWKRILDHNGIRDPRDLKAGQEIMIPSLQ